MVEMMEVVEKTAVYRSDLPEMQKKRQKKNKTKRRSEVMHSFYWSFKIITDLRLSFSCHPKYCIGFRAESRVSPALRERKGIPGLKGQKRSKHVTSRRTSLKMGLLSRMWLNP